MSTIRDYRDEVIAQQARDVLNANDRAMRAERELLERSQPNGHHTSEAAAPVLVARPALDVLTDQGPPEIVEGILWSGCITVLAGESGGSKTFVSLDLFGAIAHGVRWHGREVQHGSVVYAAYEGSLGLRLRALHEAGHRRLEDLYILEPRETLSPRVFRDGEIRSPGELAIAAAIETLSEGLARIGRAPIRALAIDTVRAALSGDENSSQDVSAFLRALRRVMAVIPDAGVLLVHHAGWQDGDDKRKRERGSSAWRGSSDATLYLEAGEYDADTGTCALSLSALKVRDGERPAPLRLVRRRVDLLERDRYNRPVTSCLIERDPRTREDLKAAEHAKQLDALWDADRRFLRVITAAPEALSLDAIQALMGCRRQDVSAARSRCLRRGWIEPFERGQPYVITEAGATALSKNLGDRALPEAQV